MLLLNCEGMHFLIQIRILFGEVVFYVAVEAAYHGLIFEFLALHKLFQIKAGL